LPQNRKNRLIQEYSLNEKEAEIFVYYKDLGEYFEKVISELPSGLTQDNLLRLIKLTANYLISDLQGLLKGQLVTDKTFFITPENFAEFITLIHEDKISSKIAKMVLLEMFKSGADPSNIVEEQGLSQITDKSQIENVVQEVVSQNEKVVQEYLAGKETVLQFLVGQVMAKTKGRVNPQLAQEALKEALTKIR
jgi:aspartyl-tRNA(Asn)/glutamyl-tRNA(Gln) amidotransferase subunit B